MMASDETDTFDEIVRRLRAGDPETAAQVSEELAKLTVPTRRSGGMPDGWYVIRVELLCGGGQDFDPPPGRDLLVSPQHTFRQLAETVNASFARWDLGHLYAFRMGDGTEIGLPYEDAPVRDAARTKIARRELHEEWEFEFDFGDGWTHRCFVTEVDVTPEDIYGVRPKGPVAVWGWGSIPDQYGRTTPDG
ncbi:MAG: IS1096 element passenger TnpR family protein [Actinomycetota bacterium]